MNLLQRAKVSIQRNFVKSGIFFLTLFILGILISGAILIRQAIFNTEQNLRRNMPAVAIVEYDFDFEEAGVIYEETGVWPELVFENLTPDLIHKIGSFSQVRVFDYSIHIHFGVTGQGLKSWQNLDWYSPAVTENDQEWGVEFGVEGVNRVDFLDARQDLIELVEGRSFLENELVQQLDTFPVLISADFAQVNELTIGSFFDIQVVVFDWIEREDGHYFEDREKPPLSEENFSLEVIGIFDPILPHLLDDADLINVLEASMRRSQINHRLYVPHKLARMLFDARGNTWALGEEIEVAFQSFFMLEDPLLFDDFAQDVENLPGNWIAVDFSTGFSDISSSMESLMGVANFILFMGVGATLLIVGFIVLLFLYDRKHEIGIYLALGEKKKKIILQVLSELIVLTVVSTTMSLFVGNIVAGEISTNILNEHLLNPSDVISSLERSHPLVDMGYQFELNVEEMLAAFEVGLDFNTVITIYVLLTVIVLCVVLISLSRIIKLNPKDILM